MDVYFSCKSMSSHSSNQFVALIALIPQSVSHTLHTCTSALFRPMLSFYLESSDSAACNTLFRRVITALIHHCDAPAQFSPISDSVMEKWTSVMNGNNEEQARRILELSSLILSVRRGSRLTGVLLFWLVLYSPPGLNKKKKRITAQDVRVSVFIPYYAYTGPRKIYDLYIYRGPFTRTHVTLAYLLLQCQCRNISFWSFS
jgi:hypothetical protein